VNLVSWFHFDSPSPYILYHHPIISFLDRIRDVVKEEEWRESTFHHGVTGA